MKKTPSTIRRPVEDYLSLPIKKRAVDKHLLCVIDDCSIVEMNSKTIKGGVRCFYGGRDCVIYTSDSIIVGRGHRIVGDNNLIVADNCQVVGNNNASRGHANRTDGCNNSNVECSPRSVISADFVETNTGSSPRVTYSSVPVPRRWCAPHVLFRVERYINVSDSSSSSESSEA